MMPDYLIWRFRKSLTKKRKYTAYLFTLFISKKQKRKDVRKGMNLGADDPLQSL
jgi:PleD family two-component response regulator